VTGFEHSAELFPRRDMTGYLGLLHKRLCSNRCTLQTKHLRKLHIRRVPAHGTKQQSPPSERLSAGFSIVASNAAFVLSAAHQSARYAAAGGGLAIAWRGRHLRPSESSGARLAQNDRSDAGMRFLLPEKTRKHSWQKRRCPQPPSRACCTRRVSTCQKLVGVRMSAGPDRSRTGWSGGLWLGQDGPTWHKRLCPPARE
jgi:hypothetical protein